MGRGIISLSDNSIIEFSVSDDKLMFPSNCLIGLWVGKIGKGGETCKLGGGRGQRWFYFCPHFTFFWFLNREYLLEVEIGGYSKSYHCSLG